MDSSLGDSLRAALQKRSANSADAPGPLDLYRIGLEGRTPTGFTIHRRGGTVLDPPASLAIVQYPGDPGYYLLYLDHNGSEQADTYHESLERAFGQAEAEFGVVRADWLPVAPPPA